MNGLFCVAVHALIYLDKRGCLLSSEELAANICTNPARVRKVMAKLKKAGLVTTRPWIWWPTLWRCGLWSLPGTAAGAWTAAVWWLPAWPG